MKTIKEAFKNDYCAGFSALGNNLSVGIGKDDSTGQYTIVANLTSSVGKSILPETYKGFKVDIRVVGNITVQ